MSEYLSSFIIDPVVRQARRFSRISSGEESPGFLPTVPESLRTWYPTRLWNTSPPPSISEDESHETTSPRLVEGFGQWTSQIPSPPLEPTENGAVAGTSPDSSNERSVTAFPPLETQMAQQDRPTQLQSLRSDSDTSLNPSQNLSYQSRRHEDGTREHSQSDPIAARSPIFPSDTSDVAGTVPGEVDREQSTTPMTNVSGTIPEDDGMGPLRRKINAIWAGTGSPQEKSRLVHRLMMERYTSAQRTSNSRPQMPLDESEIMEEPLVTASMLLSTENRDGIQGIARQSLYYNLTQKDFIPTYAPFDAADNELDGVPDETPELDLGCEHYKRNVKLQCSTCRRWYTCRLCHDEVEDHSLPRRETKNMLCMLCNTPQDVSQTCKMCGIQAACYYCSVCKLWNNDPNKAIYHCDDCGICRLGQGLGKDFFHCKTCVVCMSISAESTHRCIEQSTKCDCPICGEYLFTSSKSVVFMRCGHAIHEACFKELCSTSYKCPICSKSIANMESQFRNLDRQIASQPMPAEYREVRAYVYCNDCACKCTTKFHWLGLKCAVCESYNTTILEQFPENIGSARPSGSDIAAMADASPRVPRNVSDEAVPIPNSRAASRRPSNAISEVADTSASPWLFPRSRATRSASPVVTNYFGLDHRDRPVSPSTNQDEDDLDFWGRQSPRHEMVVEEESDEAESSTDEEMEDIDAEEEDDEEDEEEEDQMDIFGHR